jgi:hypothetical protein
LQAGLQETIFDRSLMSAKTTTRLHSEAPSRQQARTALSAHGKRHLDGNAPVHRLRDCCAVLSLMRELSQAGEYVGDPNTRVPSPAADALVDLHVA